VFNAAASTGSSGGRWLHQALLTAPRCLHRSRRFQAGQRLPRHAAGDAILKVVAATLMRTCAPPIRWAARGDEFAVSFGPERRDAAAKASRSSSRRAGDGHVGDGNALLGARSGFRCWSDDEFADALPRPTRRCTPAKRSASAILFYRRAIAQAYAIYPAELVFHKGNAVLSCNLRFFRRWTATDPSWRT